MRSHDKPVDPVIADERVDPVHKRPRVWSSVVCDQTFAADGARGEFLWNAGTDEHSFDGLVFLQADKGFKYETIKKVIYTAGITDFINLKLAVMRKKD